jgi:hypothetical protein
MVTIDLYSGQFWWFVSFALLALVPLTRVRARRWTFALLNLGFLALYTQPGSFKSLLYILGGVLACWLFLRWIGRRGASLLPVVVGGATVLTLFFIHKLPHLGSRIGLSQAEIILAAIGFSYVALRLVDLGRAVIDGRHPPPDLALTINYLLPFHMLAAGPIQAYDDFIA